MDYYLKLDTWTIEQAAYLVSGIDYKTLDDYLTPMLIHGVIGGLMAFEKGGRYLDGLPIENSDRVPFDNAKKVREIWKSRKHPPAKVSPMDFVNWCKTKDINTDWITNADEWPGFVLSQAEAMPDAGAGNNTQPASLKVNQANTNDLDFSGLLNEPTKKDSWFRIIDDMTRAFYTAYEKMPNEHQAWAALWTTPPYGYEITTSKVKVNGEDCLNTPVTKPLSYSAFIKRWKKYTTNKTQ